MWAKRAGTADTADTAHCPHRVVTRPLFAQPLDYCDEYEVKTIASAMKMNGMLELGYNYVNLGERVCR